MAKTFFVVCQLFAVCFLVADGKDHLCRLLADGKELADGKIPDSSSVRLFRDWIFLADGSGANTNQLSISHGGHPIMVSPAGNGSG